MVRDKATGRVLGRVPRFLEVPDHPDARHDVLLRLLHLAQDQGPATPSRKRDIQNTMITRVIKTPLCDEIF